MYLLPKKLGLSAFESKACICFFTMGNGLSAKEISKSTGIPLTRVYDVMKTLEEKCLVTKNKQACQVLPQRSRVFVDALAQQEEMQINEVITMLEH